MQVINIDRVKILRANSPDSLQASINSWISKSSNKYQVIDIKYQMTELRYSAMLLLHETTMTTSIATGVHN